MAGGAVAQGQRLVVQGKERTGRLLFCAAGGRRTGQTTCSLSRPFRRVASAVKNNSGCKLEREFIEGAVGERARRFCYSAVGRANLELQVRRLKPSRAGFTILLVDIQLNRRMHWSNEHMFLRKEQQELFKLHEMYQYVSVFHLSQCTGLSLFATASMLSSTSCLTPD